MFQILEMYTIVYLWSYRFPAEVNVECIKFQNHDMFFASCETHVRERIDLGFWEARLISEVYCAPIHVLDFM